MPNEQANRARLFAQKKRQHKENTGIKKNRRKRWEACGDVSRDYKKDTFAFLAESFELLYRTR